MGAAESLSRGDVDSTFYRQVGPNVGDAEVTYIYCCNECGEVIEDVRYTCSECLSYDACPSCERKTSHKHLLYREDFSAHKLLKYLKKFNTTGEILRQAFKIYEHRQAFGFRDEKNAKKENFEFIGDKKELEGVRLAPYRWITYGEVGERVDRIGRAMRQLIEPRSFVLIASHVQLGWYLSDYACQVHSMISFAINPTSSVQDIVHIVSKTKAKMAFFSSKFAERFSAAIELCPSLKYLIQIEDIEDSALDPDILLARNYVRSFSKDKVERKIFDELSFSIPFWSYPIVRSLNRELISLEPRQLNPEEVQNWRNKIFASKRPAVLCLSDLEQIGAHLVLPTIIPTPAHELESIIFTSGSTGLPKGAMFSAANWRTQMIAKHAPATIERTVTWSVSDRVNDLRTMFFGGAVGIYSGEIENLFQDIAEVRPHQLNATPAFWNKLHSEFEVELKQRTAHLRKKKKVVKFDPEKEGLPKEESSEKILSDQIFEPSSENTTMSKREREEERSKIQQQLMKEYRDLLGGRVGKIVTGGAPTSKEVMDFIWECFACLIAESYGATEVGGIVAAGQFLSNLTWKLLPWEEYSPDDKPYPRGELCVKREGQMMMGYIGDEAETNEVLDEDGFYRTGDIVEINATGDGAKVIDRKKNIFKLAQGEFVAPSKIENEIFGFLAPLVQQAFVYGNSLKDSLVAIVVPNREYLKAYCKRIKAHKMDSNLDLENIDSLCSLPHVVDHYLSEIVNTGRMRKLRSFEIPSAVFLSSSEFTVENGLMTASGKQSRHALFKRFEKEIARMYESVEARTKEIKFEVQGIIQSELLLSSSPSSSSLSSSETQECPSSSPHDSIVVDGNLSFIQAGGDSLSAIKIRKLIKEKYDIVVPVEMILGPDASIEKLANFVSSPNLSSAGDNHPDFVKSKDIDLQKVSELDKNWIPASSKAEIEDGKEKIFLTGATGFLGTAVLSNLLINTNSDIYCLIRPKASASDERSLKKNLKSRLMSSELLSHHFESKEDIEDIFERRVFVVVGKLEERRFGLEKKPKTRENRNSQSELISIGEEEIGEMNLSNGEIGLEKMTKWQQLGKTISLIIHCGAQVNSIMPYSILAPSNVEGTRTCIEMCTSGIRKRLIHVSTTSVVENFKKSMEEPLKRSLIPKTLIENAAGYTSSKYVAEVLVWEAIERGFEAIVVRPGFIGSSGLTGFSNHSDADNLILSAMASIGLSPSSNTSIPLATMSVDTMADGITHIVKELDFESAKNFAIHFEDGNSELCLELIIKVLKKRGYIKSEANYAEWRDTCAKRRETNRFWSYWGELFSATTSFPSREPVHASKNTQDLVLSKIKGKRVATDEAFVEKWIQWLEKNGHLSLPTVDALRH